jgi:hypothetical protein
VFVHISGGRRFRDPRNLRSARRDTPLCGTRSRGARVRGGRLAGIRAVRPYVRLRGEGGSPYAALARVARTGRAYPHRRRTSHGGL